MITGSKGAITFCVMLAALMALTDITITNVALNDIRSSFGTPLDEIGWVSTGYMMANIVVIPLTGWFQRRFGFRRYFAASILVFTVASALCGLSWNLPSLVVFRALQGLGGGAIIPTSQSILLARYPKEQHGMANALFGLGAVTGPLLGPTVGGYLIDSASWHWCFLVNLPLGLLASFVAYRVIEEPGFKPSRDPIDVFGIGLLAVGMPCLQYVLEEGNREGWFESTTISVLLAVAVVSLTTFVVHELETEHPVVDLRVFSNRSYAAGTGINLLVGLALFAGNYLFSLYCGVVMHYSALDLGRVFLVAGVVQVFLMPVLGRTVTKVDPRIFLLIGVIGTFESLWMNAHLTNEAAFRELVWPQLIRAAALGFIFVPVSLVALSDVPDAKRGNAAGLFNLTRELGGSIGTAWMGLLVDQRTKVHASYLREYASATNPLYQERYAALSLSLGRSNWTAQYTPEKAIDYTVTTQAQILAFGDGFFNTAFVFACAVILVLLLKRPKPGVVVEGAH
jgi:MFS transporter, DHA2 family, multidrug resistance protein